MLLSEVGSTFSNLGQPQAALAPAERSVALLEPQREQHATEYLDNLDALLVVDNFLGRYQDVIDRVAKALPLARRASGEKKMPAYATLLTRRSAALSRLGRVAEAEADTREALRYLDAIGEGNSDEAVEVLNDLAVTLNLQSEYPEAQAALRRIIALEGRTPPIMKSALLTAKMNLAVGLYDTGRTSEAVELLEPVPAQTETMVGAAHFATIASKMLLLHGYLATGDPLRARPLFEQLQAVFSSAGAQFARAQGYAADGMLSYELAAGRFGEAAQLARNYLDAAPEGTSADPRRRKNIRRLFGEAQLHLGQPEQALRTFQAVMDELEPGEIVRLAELEDGIGRARLAGGDAAAAVEPLHRAAEDLRSIQGADKPAVLRSEIHELWARALASGDAQFLDHLRDKRAALVAALGGEDKLQVWQFDVLLDGLCRHFGRPGIDRDRLARAEAGLRRIAAASTPPAYVGLSQF